MAVLRDKKYKTNSTCKYDLKLVSGMGINFGNTAAAANADDLLPGPSRLVLPVPKSRDTSKCLNEGSY